MVYIRYTCAKYLRLMCNISLEIVIRFTVSLLKFLSEFDSQQDQPKTDVTDGKFPKFTSNLSSEKLDRLNQPTIFSSFLHLRLTFTVTPLLSGMVVVKLLEQSRKVATLSTRKSPSTK